MRSYRFVSMCTKSSKSGVYFISTRLVLTADISHAQSLPDASGDQAAQPSFTQVDAVPSQGEMKVEPHVTGLLPPLPYQFL